MEVLKHSKKKVLTSQPLVLQVANKYIKANPFKISKQSKRIGKGRPTVMTMLVVGKLEHAFAFDCTVEEACVYAGIARDTYYAFCKEYPDFSDRVTALRNMPVLVARMTLVSSLQDDANLALRYLEKKRPQEFSTRNIDSLQSSKPARTVSTKELNAIDNIFELFEKKAREVEKQVIVEDVI